MGHIRMPPRSEVKVVWDDDGPMLLVTCRDGTLVTTPLKKGQTVVIEPNVSLDVTFRELKAE